MACNRHSREAAERGSLVSGPLILFRSKSNGQFMRTNNQEETSWRGGSLRFWPQVQLGNAQAWGRPLLVSVLEAAFSHLRQDG